METKKNNITIKKQLLLGYSVLMLTLLSLSCAKDQESVTDSDAAFPKEILSDPLFEKVDKAFYEVDLDVLKYGGGKVDQKLVAALKEDVKNKKIKSYAEFCQRQEAAGYKDFAIRFKTMIEFRMSQEALFKKYPELAANKKEFSTFFIKNRKHKITPRVFMAYHSKNINSNNYLKSKK